MSDANSAEDLKKHVRAYILVFVSLMFLTLVTVAVSTQHLEVHQAIIVALIFVVAAFMSAVAGLTTLMLRIDACASTLTWRLPGWAIR